MRDDVAEASALPRFVRGLSPAALPPDVVAQAQRCLLDLIGVAAGGARTQASQLVGAYVVAQQAGRDREARLLFDGRRASPAGAAFAGAMTIDALDAHDGHVLTKGHAGVAILPALLALVDAEPALAPDGPEFLLNLALGYEVATRAGIALHSTVADYHCSGAWNALGCVAVAARLWRLDDVRFRHALGVAEYFGPRGQILRACDHPTMVKDGSAWGAHAGLVAAYLAREGFTGAPAVTVEREDAAALWQDLGTRWRILEQYFKAYPVCRWAQPAIEAALDLQRAHGFAAADVAGIEIASFREAVALGSAVALPANTEEAQYSITFPVAAALVQGGVDADAVGARGLGDPGVARLARAVRLVEDAAFSSRFPAERWARVTIALADGRRLVSAPARARGNPENPLSDDELLAKYRALAVPALGTARAAAIEAEVAALARPGAPIAPLLDRLLAPLSDLRQ